MPSSRRIYSEMLPYRDLVERETIALLAKYKLEVVLAVRPWNLVELPEVAKTLAGEGVALSVWPMLADEEGRWASVHNASSFAKLTLETCDVLEAKGKAPRDVLFDLEPPFAQARTLASMGASRSRSPEGLARFAAGLSRATNKELEGAASTFAETVGALHARGISTSMAVWPLVALDPPGERAWQSLLGTPVDALGTSHVSVMMYTSILEGWSRGTLRRRDTTALLAAATLRTVRRWGATAGVSLGCVGTGAFEDEPIYRDPTELAEDVAVARAAGCDELTLFDLAGVLSRGPAEAWLDAFALSPAPVDDAKAHLNSKRVRAARTLARAATWALARHRF